MKAIFARALFACGLPAFCLLLAARPALAHKVSVYVYVENGQIKGEGYFAGGDKARGCNIEVLDASGGAVAKAVTDQRGEFSLPLPEAAPPLKIILRAGQGHQGDYTLTAADLGAPAGDAAVTSAPPPPPPATAGIFSAELEQALAKALDQRLAPLTVQVAKLASGRGSTLQDVIGGIGYILGLMGIVAYVKSRQDASPPRN